MNFIISDKNNERRELTILALSPNIRLHEAEPQFSGLHEYNEELDGYMCTEKEFEELKNWWVKHSEAMVCRTETTSKFEYFHCGDEQKPLYREQLQAGC